ncbi:hypothetical protein [Lysobacter sp. HA35]
MVLWDSFENHGYGVRSALGTAVFFAAVYAVPIACLWFKADWLGRKITHGITAEAPVARSRDLQQVGFSLVGLYLSASASYQLLALASLWLWQQSRSVDVPMAMQLDPFRVYCAVLMLGIGLWLLLGSRRFGAWLRFLRGRA